MLRRVVWQQLWLQVDAKTQLLLMSWMLRDAILELDGE